LKLYSKAGMFLVIVSQLVLSLRGRSSTHKEVRNVCRVITDFDVLDYKIRELSLALGKIYLVI
jgi:hypothetical protein